MQPDSAREGGATMAAKRRISLFRSGFPVNFAASTIMGQSRFQLWCCRGQTPRPKAFKSRVPLPEKSSSLRALSALQPSVYHNPGGDCTGNECGEEQQPAPVLAGMPD